MSAEPQTQPTLHTPRLTLRPFTIADADDFRMIVEIPEVADTTIWLIPGTEEEWIHTHEQQFADKVAAHYAIEQGGHLVGYVTVAAWMPHRCAHLDYFIRPSHWNQGYMTEACLSLLAFAFDVWKLHRVHSSHFSRNPASGRVMQKLGMAHEGTLRQHILKDGHFEDLEIYGLLADEWIERTAGVHR